MRRLCWLLLVCVLGVSTCLGQEETTPEESSDWKKDPVCQAVFFGVLEGLYRDNVSIEVVDNIIGSHDSKLSLEKRFQRSFVLDCPLCEPAFHAFLAYQGHRVQLEGFEIGEPSAKLDPEIEKRLLAKDNQTRLEATSQVH